MNTEYLQYRTADLLAHVLPRRWSYELGIRVADHLYRRDDAGRRAVQSNLRRIYEHQGIRLTDDAVDQTARETFRNFGKYMVDFFRFTRISRLEIARLIRVIHPEYIGQAVSEGKGVLAVTAHLGNWEIGGALLSFFGYPLNVVVLPMKDKKTNALFQSRREQRGMRVIPLGRTVRGIYDALNRKEVVALLGDRDYSPHHHEVMFFGASACLPIGPAKLCWHTGAPIVPGFLVRQPDDTFLFRLHPPISTDGQGVDAIRDQVLRVLEWEIAQNPSQWFIFTPFWNNGAPPVR